MLFYFSDIDEVRVCVCVCVGGSIDLLRLFSKLPKNVQESEYFMAFYIVCLC